MLKFLGDLRLEAKPERRQVCVNLCVSAYPDIQPWQVRQACWTSTISGTGKNIPCSEEIMSDLFYTYLSQLLHPLEGHDAARRDWNLVKVSSQNVLRCHSDMEITNYELPLGNII